MAMAQDERRSASEAVRGLDVRRAFTFVFEDPDWPAKLGLGGLLVAIPWLGTLFLYAYILRAMRWVALDQTATLPQWRRSDLKRMLKEGLRFVVVWLLLICPLALGLLVWWFLGGPVPDYERNVPFLFQGNDSRMLGLVFAIVLVVAQGRLAITESIWSASRPDEIVTTFLAAPAAWLLAAFAALLLGEVRDLLVWYLNPAGLGTFLVNSLLTMTTSLYLGLVAAHLAGQACRQARRTWGRQALARYR